MALKGDFIFKKWVKTGTEDVTFVVPEDISEDDPHYENRGKEITITKDVGEVQNDPDDTFVDHVLAINSCGLHSERPQPNNKIWNVAIIYAIYKNEEDRLNSRGVLKAGTITRWHGVDFEEVQKATNIYEFCYDYLKKEEWVNKAENI